MVLLAAEGLNKTFGDKTVLDSVDIEIRRGDHIALVGPNGTGKTTLLRILTGQQPSDGGRISLSGSTTVGYLEQHPTFAQGDTLWSVAADAVGDIVALAKEAEDVAQKLAECSDAREHERLLEHLDYLQARLQHSDAYSWENRVERTLQGLGFTKSWFERPAASLSGGQQNRLMLAHLLLKEPELMILDEPNNHLDIESTEWLETTLSNWSGAFLLVSHDRFFLDQVTTEVGNWSMPSSITSEATTPRMCVKKQSDSKSNAVPSRSSAKRLKSWRTSYANIMRVKRARRPKTDARSSNVSKRSSSLVKSTLPSSAFPGHAHG